jgi:hypothetical protein
MSERTVAQTQQQAQTSPAHTGRILQRKCACGQHTMAGGECQECGKKRNGIQRETINQSANGAGVSLLGIPVMQRKLMVGASNDPLEQEADRVADQVLAAPAHSVVSGTPPHIQRYAGQATESTETAPASVDRVLANPGKPLEPALRQDMEQRFGYDFSRVRVRSDAVAAQSARDVNAHAYTVGHDIVFGAGKFAPATQEGRRLLAHELTHVVQQDNEPALRRTVHRSSCPHDEPFGSGCGVFEWKGPASDLADFVQVGTDRIITASLPQHFSGTWLPQLLSPPNLAKGGKSHGFVDAAKVNTTGGLTVEVLEIKSRNTNNGGCALATTETDGYVQALRPLAPHVVNLSAGLAKVGGLRTDECRNISAAEKQTLVAAGLDVNNPDSVRAWCLYNDLQNKLNRTFTTGFATATFTANKDGAAKTDYVVGVIPITCKRGRKTVAGTKKLVFEVNTKGGLSYRCDKRCGDQPEEEKEKVKEERKEIEVPVDKRLRGIEQPDQEDDYDPIEDDIRVPPEGIDVTDVLIATTVGIATVATVHALMKKAKTEAEKKALKVVAEKAIEKMAKRGASQAARHLNSQNLAKIGTKAYEQAVKKAEQEAAKRLARTTEEKLAKRLSSKLGEKAAKQGAKAIFKAAGKALPVIGILLTAGEVLAAVDAISKGAELGIGFSGSEADLGAGTDIKVKGEKSKDGATTDVKTEQTEVDIEMDKAPDVQGIMEIETKQVKIKGKVDGKDGDPVMVNLKVKMQNTTVVFRSTGKFKGGNIVVDGGLEITDSEIEIDLPPDTVLDPPEPGQQRVIKGVKVKVTKVGSGMGTPGTQGQSGTGGQPGTKVQPPPVGEERKKLLGEIQGDPGVKKIYDAVIRPQGVPVTDEVLRRLLALKEQLKQHPEVVDRVIGILQKGGLKDPIKDLIEPMEAEIRKAIEEKAKKQQPPPPRTGGTPSDKPTKDTPPPTTPQTASPVADPCKDAEKLDLWPIVDAVLSGKPSGLPADIAVRLGKKTFDEKTPKPTETATSPVYFGRKTPDGLRKYTVWVHGKDMKPLKTWDKKLFVWAADYEFTAPSGVIMSDQGDWPICFNDGGTTRRMTWGMLKKTK